MNIFYIAKGTDNRSLIIEKAQKHRKIDQTKESGTRPTYTRSSELR